MKAAVVNAGRGGAGGNSAALCQLAAAHLTDRRVEVEVVTLAEIPGFAPHRGAFERADLLVFATGTYWDAWSSKLGELLEEATPTEGTALWLGKPVCVLVSAHEVGGKGVLSRLQGVLVTMGCLVPPMSGVVVNRSSDIARAHATPGEADDLWGPADVEVAIHNVVEAARGTRGWRAWDVDRERFAERWLRPRG
ncbi:MAG: NAD(P)H-dependent oxidoreductase [Sandaracinaceae bacterium]|nr:NAD(P)H-dependent oxidoreductase [Sandaracinaceae bacterium]